MFNYQSGQIQFGKMERNGRKSAKKYSEYILIRPKLLYLMLHTPTIIIIQHYGRRLLRNTRELIKKT